jgi:multidrug efflux pump subunit AcrA (membrane-fusion protein)
MTTYTVTCKTFENNILIDGVVESVNSTTIALSLPREGTIGFLVEDGTFVKEGELVCSIEIPEIQTNYDKLVLDLENAKAEFEKRKAELNMEYAILEAQVKSNEASAKIAALDSLQLKYTPLTQRQIRELELEIVEIDKNRYDKKLKALSVIQQSEIRKNEIQIQSLENRVNSAKSELESLNLKAPKAGLAIRGSSFLTGNKFLVGDLVWRGISIVSIPEMDKMKVNIQALEQDFKYINTNDSVMYVFDAMPENRAWGKITRKTPVGKQYKNGSNVKFFDIEASIDSFISLPEPGYTVNCKVILSQLKDTIVIPQIAVFDEDSTKNVFVRYNKGIEMREVQLGLSSSKEAVITGGLHVDEVILLTKPGKSLIKKRTLLGDTILTMNDEL